MKVTYAAKKELRELTKIKGDGRNAVYGVAKGPTLIKGFPWTSRCNLPKRQELFLLKSSLILLEKGTEKTVYCCGQMAL